MESITISMLARMLQQEIKNGNGAKKILLSNDDEGNGYHEMFFGVTSGKNMEEMGEYLVTNHYMLPFGVSEQNINEYVIIG